MFLVQRVEAAQRHTEIQNRTHALMHAGPDIQKDTFGGRYTDNHLQSDSVILHGQAEQYIEIMTHADILQCSTRNPKCHCPLREPRKSNRVHWFRSWCFSVSLSENREIIFNLWEHQTAAYGEVNTEATASAVVLVQEEISAGIPHAGQHVCTQVTPLGDACCQVIPILSLEVLSPAHVCTS